MLGTVIAFAVLAVLATVSVGAAWKLTAPQPVAPGDEVGVEPGDGPARAAEDPSSVVSAARSMVLTSHARALISELSALGLHGELSGADVDAALGRFPVQADGVTITASASSFSVDRTVRLTDGSATVCVVVPTGGQPHLGGC